MSKSVTLFGESFDSLYKAWNKHSNEPWCVDYTTFSQRVDKGYPVEESLYMTTLELRSEFDDRDSELLEYDLEQYESCAVSQTMESAYDIHHLPEKVIREALKRKSASPNNDRNVECFIRHFIGGESFASIGDSFGITAKRVQSICSQISWSVRNRIIRGKMIDSDDLDAAKSAMGWL